MTSPHIRRWLTPAGFAAAVPALATYPLPAISHALARLRTTAVAVLDAPEADHAAVYLVAPSHALLAEVTGEAPDAGHSLRHVHLPPPLSGSAAADMPVPVVGVDTVLAELRQPGCAHLWPTGEFPYLDGSAHRAITALAAAAGTASHAMAHDPEQDLTLILPALARVLDDLSAVADGLTPYCGDYADQAEARLATITALLADCAAMARHAHTDVAARLHLDQRAPDLRLTAITLQPEPAGHEWTWHATADLADRRAEATGQLTARTTGPHPDMAAAIDAVREIARAVTASRPDPGAPTAVLRLAAHVAEPLAEWLDELDSHAARLRMRPSAPSASDRSRRPVPLGAGAAHNAPKRPD